MTTSILPGSFDESASIALRYQPAQWHPPVSKQALLAVVPAGGTTSAVVAPVIAVPTLPLGPNPMTEIWETDQPVTRLSGSSIVYSTAGDLLMGGAIAGPDEDLASATRRIYDEILELVDDENRPHLVRLWNYFPRINEFEQTERYQQFCAARFEAFTAAGYDMASDLPAASAVGSQNGALTVVFIASSRRPRYVENPRQISAFSYPRQYGTRSPSFSRGAVLPDGSTLLVSGTASIVGHETVHRGDLGAQVEETLRNIDAVIAEAFGPDTSLHSEDLDIRLKVYVRHPADQPRIAARLERTVSPRSISYLRADICRADLLVEIEACIRRS